MPAYSAAWPLAGSLADLGREQDGVVGRAQLHALGVTRQHLRNEVRARRWRLVGRGAVVLHRGSLSPAQRRWAVLLNAGPRAALAGLTAAALGGLTGFATADVHVLVPRGVLRFATLTLRLEPERFVDQVRRALLTGKPDSRRSA